LAAAAALVVVAGAALPARAGDGEARAAAAEVSEVDQQARRKWKKRWIASWVALAAVNALDVQSSRGRGEANPLLRNGAGRFSLGRAVAVKSALSGSFFVSQLLIIRQRPQGNPYKGFFWANTVGAGTLGGVVVHNYSLDAPRPKTTRTVPAHLAPAPAEAP
jgi:hypothetical protein